MPKRFEPSIDFWKVALLPIMVRLGKAKPLTVDFPGIAHRSDIKILRAIRCFRPTGPNEIKFRHLKHRAVDDPIDLSTPRFSQKQRAHGSSVPPSRTHIR